MRELVTACDYKMDLVSRACSKYSGRVLISHVLTSSIRLPKEKGIERERESVHAVKRERESEHAYGQKYRHTKHPLA